MSYIHIIHPQKGTSSDTCCNVDEHWKHGKWKKPVTKEHLLCDSIYIKYSEEAKV